MQTFKSKQNKQTIKKDSEDKVQEKISYFVSCKAYKHFLFFNRWALLLGAVIGAIFSFILWIFATNVDTAIATWFILAYIVSSFIYYFLGIARISEIFSLAPHKNNTCSIHLHTFAWIKYNKVPRRKEYILKKLAEVFNYLSHEKDVNEVIIQTWLFTPDNLPPGIPRPDEYRSLYRFKVLIPTCSAMFSHILACLFRKEKVFQIFKKQNPFNSKTWHMVWRFKE